MLFYLLELHLEVVLFRGEPFDFLVQLLHLVFEPLHLFLEVVLVFRPLEFAGHEASLYLLHIFLHVVIVLHHLLLIHLRLGIELLELQLPVGLPLLVVLLDLILQLFNLRDVLLLRLLQAHNSVLLFCQLVLEVIDFVIQVLLLLSQLLELLLVFQEHDLDVGLGAAQHFQLKELFPVVLQVTGPALASLRLRLGGLRLGQWGLLLLLQLRGLLLLAAVCRDVLDNLRIGVLFDWGDLFLRGTDDHVPLRLRGKRLEFAGNRLHIAVPLDFLQFALQVQNFLLRLELQAVVLLRVLLVSLVQFLDHQLELLVLLGQLRLLQLDHLQVLLELILFLLELVQELPLFLELGHLLLLGLFQELLLLLELDLQVFHLFLLLLEVVDFLFEFLLLRALFLL